MKFYFQKWPGLPGFAVMAALALGLATPVCAADLRLIMFEEAGCMWCARWERDIGPIYPKTSESEAAPLTRLDISEPLPEGIALDRPAHFTPTFVLLADGAETGRIEGYPGQDFFWGLLDALIAEAGDPPSPS